MAREQMEKLGFSFDDIKDMKFNDQMKKIAGGLKQVGSETERNRILMNLFDVETAGAAGTLITGFLEGKEVITEMAEQVGNATTAMKTADEIANDLLGKINGMKSAVQDRLLEVFQLLEPVIKRIVDKVTQMVRSLSDEDPRERGGYYGWIQCIAT